MLKTLSAVPGDKEGEVSPPTHPCMYVRGFAYTTESTFFCDIWSDVPSVPRPSSSGTGLSLVCSCHPGFPGAVLSGSGGWWRGWKRV